VPTTAVQSFEGKSVVFVRTPTGFKATPVQLGDASGDTVIVRSGLTGNEQIATTGSFTLKAESARAKRARGLSHDRPYRHLGGREALASPAAHRHRRRHRRLFLYRLPIDAVPDITNNQVQINVRAPALSPELVEKQVSFPIDGARRHPGLEYTRSLSRNGFAQITASSDATDIYFARQQVGERLQGVPRICPTA
jgi:hypothetical protein